jgi:hypothetical protein
VSALVAEPHVPVGWDPFLADKMSVLDVHRHGTEHFDFHRRQLTLR